MTEIQKKVLPPLLALFCIGFVLCLVFVFIRPVSSDLIAPFVIGYRIRQAIKLFVQYMPALQISGLLLGYAWGFSVNAEDTVERWSATLLSLLKGAFLLSFVCVAAYVILAEGIVPVSVSRQKQAEVQTADYRDFMQTAQHSFAIGTYKKAELYCQSALRIWPSSPDATVLLEEARYKAAQAVDVANAGSYTGDTDQTADELTVRNSNGLTVLDALDLAEKAEEESDYFNAHYYATLAYRLAPATDPNKEIAKRKASEAWNHISTETDTTAAKENADLYNTKKRGYDAIERGDYLTAYYIFLDLHNAQLISSDRKYDPDVDRFLEIAQKGVLESFFFIDETVNIRSFERSRDIFFVIKHVDGSSEAVSIRGITYTKAGRKDMAYLRGFEYISFDRNNVLQYQILVPYVKMFSFIREGEKIARPELLLRAVNRNHSDKDIVPSVLAGSVPENEKNILILNMPFRDFDLLVSANQGPETMSLLELFYFLPIAEKYGYSEVVYLRAIINRLADPFLILILSILALVFAWKLRMGQNTVFKAWWIISVPILVLVSWFIIDMVRRFSNLCITGIVSLFPDYALIIVLVLLSFLFLCVSIYFFSQRSD